MRGSIRALVGFVIVFNAGSSMDNCTDSQLVSLLVFAIVGLGIMASGIAAMNRINYYY